jgi:sigma-54 dependent transcriptional regulator, acetoin dehydrogenase operon transcriptional activator AcoR
MASHSPVSGAASRQRRQDEQNRPLATALALGSEHLASIEESHERCAAFGLSRIERPDHAPLGRSDLNVARDRNQRLYSHAAPVMEMLHEQIVNSASMVVLCDAAGTIIHSIGDDDFLARASKVALQPGVNWSEPAKGTNAIGTALVNEMPTLVHADEHFMHANHFLTCSAAPILDPRGNVLGVLDVTGDHRAYHQHTMALVKMSARMIENHWLSDDFSNKMRLHFHARPEFIGTLMEGILAVTPDGKIVGANRSALDQLGMSGAALRMHTLVSLLGTTVAALVDHFRAPLSLPLTVTLYDGRLLYLQARFNWPAWHGVPDDRSAGTSAWVQIASPDRARPVPASTFLDSTRPDQHGAAGDNPRVGAANAARKGLPDGRTASGLSHLDTGDAQMKAVIGKIRRVLDRDIPVLLLGETGTGKELLARAIHHDSRRSRQPFVAVNCASIPETLIEAELFGYEEGAFTGARRKGAPGRIVQAHGGTLFLDEIGDMPIALQARLLRVLQERQVTPLGSSKSVAVDVALVCATHCKLREMIDAGRFREDLYYRLNGLAVRLPALRERSDLQVLTQRILATEWAQEAGQDAQREGLRGPLQLAPDVQALFQAYHWPGNVRQLFNVLRTAAVMAAHDPSIQREHLSDDFLEDTCAQAPAAGQAPAAAAAAQPRSLEEVEIDAIRRAVDAVGGNISEASKRLGISRNTIYRKLRWKATRS